ncbi:MMPL family transporter [Sulfobacillus harzensis]|uniref:MMPL family transporter n=1 Tax=Sulfobacillus harzensis TaxID=2729629 RepID=A0A7Y0L3D8_9FIRM|nr:MMPL family transporter [Sulfobacillus harzensis]NMP22465.1 MMPL family transporter [Sulfobacillus harzensis]
MIAKWSQFVVRHRWVVIVLWAVLVLATVPLATQVTKHLTTNGFDRKNSQVAWATNAVNEIHPLPSAKPLLIEGMGRKTAEVLGAHYGASAGDFHALTPSETVFLPPASMTASHGKRFEVQLRNRHATVTEVGQLAIGKKVTHDVSKTLTQSGLVALPVLALLLMVFGSVMSIALPFIIALAGSELALAAIAIISRHMTLSVFLTDIVSFLALGVGIDYALFISTRFRQNVDAGQSIEEAVADSMSHAGRSVLYSGIAVGLAVATLLLGNNAYWRGLAMGGAVALFAVLLATHSLLPAVMGVLGRHLNWGRVRRPDFGLWSWLARVVATRPVWSMLVGLVILVPLATLAPSIRMSTPANLATMLPPTNPLRRAVAVQQRVNGPGSIAPIAVMVRLKDSKDTPAAWSALGRLTNHLKTLPNVHSVSSATGLGLSPAQLALMASDPARAPKPVSEALTNYLAPRNSHLFAVYVTAKTGPNDARTSQLVGDIDHHLPHWLPSGSRAYAGGLVPVLRDFNDLTSQRLPWIVAAALVVALVVLTAATGSLLQAVLGVLFDGLVAMATAGFLVLVSHQQWFGFQNQPLDSSITPLIFVLLFGLSMDYEVILLHRIQERVRAGVAMQEGVRQGVATTGAMITGAGMIMVVVFLALLISPLQIMKTLGIGLSFAVLADTWVVRSLLVPSATALFGKYGFWPWRPRQSSADML